MFEIQISHIFRSIQAISVLDHFQYHRLHAVCGFFLLQSLQTIFFTFLLRIQTNAINNQFYIHATAGVLRQPHLPLTLSIFIKHPHLDSKEHRKEIIIKETHEMNSPKTCFFFCSHSSCYSFLFFCCIFSPTDTNVFRHCSQKMCG